MTPQPLSGDMVWITWEIQQLRYNGGKNQSLLSYSLSVYRIVAVGALALLIWDIIITFPDEVHYIWPQSQRSPTKWVFLLTRYFGLLAQASKLTNVFTSASSSTRRLVSICLTVIDSQFSIEECRMIYATQVVCGGILMACIQAILMLRVYALYSQDRRIAVAMITLLVAEIGSMPGVIQLTMPTNTGNMCMKPITVRDIALFGVSAILPQLLVLGLTIVKFFSGLRDGWGAIPIVSRLVRDDIILVAVIVVWVVISAALTSINTMYGYIGYSYVRFRSFLSFSCRRSHYPTSLLSDFSTHFILRWWSQLVAIFNPVRGGPAQPNLLSAAARLIPASVDRDAEW
ncbi:hypothetical protein CVT25_009562 [Psilocybe cyanescens]|uniref:DUF6533 domain-containing protein n=1 Tax=Psilocybe cyanescens TaxID=93625 RepID=A0A409XVH8_PSICY|nr:hypothetical protein CVT25_009562 [Psilocybe cyanescens]